MLLTCGTKVRAKHEEKARGLDRVGSPPLNRSVIQGWEATKSPSHALALAPAFLSVTPERESAAQPTKYDPITAYLS